MCTYSITLDDSLMERVRQAFSSEAALQSWMTEQMKKMLTSFCARKYAPPYSYNEEEMYHIVETRLNKLESGEAELVDGDIMFSQIRSKYGIEAEVASCL